MQDQNLPPLPPGFTLDTPQAAPSAPQGRPIIRRGEAPPKPSLPQGYRLNADGSASKIPGIEEKPEKVDDNLPTGYRMGPNGVAERIPGLPPAAAAESGGTDPKVAQRLANLESLTNQIQRVEGLYKKNFANQGLSTIGEYLPSWANDDVAAFESATAGLAEQGLAAFRVPGVGAQSDTELRQFVAANRPSARDRDTAIEEKLRQLKGRVDATRQQMGLDPVNWDGSEQPKPESDRDSAVAPMPNMDDAEGDTKDTIDPERRALAGEIGTMLMQGLPKSAIIARATELDPRFAQDKKLSSTLDEAIAYLATPDGQRYRVLNEGKPYPIGPELYTRTEGKSLLEKGATTLKGLLGDEGTAFAVGAANSATGGLLDEAADLAGGDAERAQLTKDRLRDESPIASIAGEIAGATFVGSKIAALPKINPITGEVIYGTIYGAGENNDDRLAGGAVGAAAGYAGGKVGEKIGDIVTARRSAKAVDPERVARREGYDAAQRLSGREGVNIDMLPADVGGTVTKKLSAGAAAGPFSAAPIIKRAQGVNAGGQAARDSIAGDVGMAVEREEAGQAVRKGADEFIRNTSKKGGDLYDMAADRSAGARVALPRAKEALDRQIAELSEVPGGAEGLTTLRELRAQLDGEFTVRGIRGMRTALRDKFIKDGLRGSDLERRVNQVIQAASEDMTEGLAEQGLNNAAGIYRRADQYWGARLKRIDDVLEPMIGKNGDISGEKVMSRIEAATRGDNARLRSLLRSLPEQDQATVRATLIGNLGKSAPGTQDAAGEAFSLPVFLSHWNRLSPGAKRTLFQGETSKALDDLAKVAEGAKAAQAHQNFSMTGNAVGVQALVTGGPGVLAATGNPMLLAASLASQYGFGKMMASRRFAAWLARTPKQGMTPEHIAKLKNVAAADSAVAAEVTGLRQALLGANDNATIPLAASETEEGEDDERR